VRDGVPVATKLLPFQVVRAFVTKPAELTEIVPEVVKGPPVRPFPVATDVTVPPEEETRQVPLTANILRTGD